MKQRSVPPYGPRGSRRTLFTYVTDHLLRPLLAWSAVCVVVLDYGQWLVIEPIMTVEAVAPTEFQGTVLGGLTKRHAVIITQDATEGYFTVICEVGRVSTQLCS